MTDTPEPLSLPRLLVLEDLAKVAIRRRESPPAIYGLMDVRADEHLSLIAEVKRLRSMVEPQPMESAPRNGTRFPAIVDGDWRTVAWGKTSHVPLYGWILVDQGPEDADLCKPTAWYRLPSPPSS